MLISTIDGLDINGTLYDVTFHPDQSFNDLWDQDADGTFGAFGGGSSVFNKMPTFWGDRVGAAAARDALIAFFPDDGSAGTFGPDDFCGDLGFCDSFLVPFGILIPFGAPNPSFEVLVYLDGGIAAVDDRPLEAEIRHPDIPGIEVPFASFRSTGGAVPEPPALALLSLGLAGLGWSRRKRAH